MKIKMLVENTAISKEYSKRHGLCLYIETEHHNILFDLGPDDLFLQNARKSNIDIADVDIVVLSHGHSDHGGALGTFLAHNQKAIIYVHKNAFEPHYAKLLFLNLYVGLDKSLQHNNRIVFLDGEHRIDDNIQIFSDVKGKKLLPQSNHALFIKKDGNYIQDDFCHEQHMLICEHGKTALFAGCSHNGIVNIMEKALTYANPIDYVCSGFHLYNPISGKLEKPELILQVASELKKYDTKYYTFHCTGQKAFKMLKHTLKEQVQYLSTGDNCQFN